MMLCKLTLANTFRQTLTLLVLCLLPITSLHAASTPLHSNGLSARWALGSETLVERQRHTVFLELISDTPITDVLSVESISASDLFFEQTTTFWQYTRPIESGQRVVKAALKLELYPAKSGQFTLPSVNIQLGRGDKAQQIPTAPLNIDVQALPQAAQGKIAAPSMNARQSLSETNITEGGAVTRTITLSVTDLPGHYIAELPFVEQIEGVEIRTGSSRATTDSFRAEMTGTRSTDVHYRFTTQGEYSLPAMTFEWWNTQTQQVETATVNAIKVQVNPAPPLPWDQQLEIWISKSKEWLLTQRRNLILSLLLLAAVWRFKPLISRVAERARRKQRHIAQHPLSQQVTFIAKVTMSSQHKLPKVIYSWLAQQAIYDIRQHPLTRSTIRFDSNGKWAVDKTRLVRGLLRELKQGYIQRYRLQLLNTKKPT
ncbi:hypothetical protein ACPV5S_17955 [Vibrio astriarenae]